MVEKKDKKVGVKEASKVEVSGKVSGKGKAALKADLNKLVAFTRSNKFKTMTGKKRVWAQIDNYRVALGTLKQNKRKSISQNNPTGTTTYGKGKIKVAKEKGFSIDAGRGGGAKSTQRPSATGKKPGVKTPPTGPYVSAPKRKYDPASTMATTGSYRSGGNYTGGSSEYTKYTNRRPAAPKPRGR